MSDTLSPAAIFAVLSGLLLSPLMMGIINKTKAFFGGRKGPPVIQGYRDFIKLIGKGAVYSHTTTWIFRAGPTVSLAALILALTIIPLGSVAAPLHFTGDLIVVLALMAVGRFITMLAALDTGSPFEAMGASREAHFSAMGEPVLFFALAALVSATGKLSLSEIYASLALEQWLAIFPIIILVGATLLVVLLVENSRIPVDDPTTHLELTMIHEVMVLDHGGPDLAFIEYAAALKMWIIGSLFVGLFVPIHSGIPWVDGVVVIAGLAVVSVIVGVIESIMARLRMPNVPDLIFGAGASAAIALALTMMGRM